MMLAIAPASATLTSFYQTTGTVGLSSDGCGTTSSSCPLVINVPAGSTVLAAYLYTAVYDFTSVGGPDPSSYTSVLSSGAVNSGNLTYTNLPANPDAGFLQAGRVDVTSVVNSVVGSGGGPFTFNVTESTSVDNTNSLGQDGEALFVIYSNPALPTQSVALIDGAAATAGDSTTINFSQAIDPTAPGFVANMRVADSFSFDQTPPDTQVSVITVNGQTLSNNVGDCDDGLKIDGACANGNLITVGGDSDPVTGPDSAVAGDPTSVANTHESFDISSLLSKGDTSINVTTFNASNDDNIFALAFTVSGIAGFNQPPPDGGDVPEPMTVSLFGAGLAGLVMAARRRKAKA